MYLTQTWFKGFLTIAIGLVTCFTIKAQSKTLTNEDFNKPAEKQDLELLPGNISTFKKIINPSLCGYVFYIPSDWSAGPTESKGGGFLPLNFDCFIQGPIEYTALAALANPTNPDAKMIKKSIYDPNNFKDKNKKTVTKQINGFDVTIHVIEEYPNQCRVAIIFESKSDPSVLLIFGAVNKSLIPQLGAIVHSVSKIANN